MSAARRFTLRRARDDGHCSRRHPVRVAASNAAAQTRDRQRAAIASAAPAVLLRVMMNDETIDAPEAPDAAREKFENFASFRHAVLQPRFAVATLAEEALDGKSATARARSLLLDSVAALERAALSAGELVYWTTAQPVLNPTRVRLDAALRTIVDRAHTEAAAAGLGFEANIVPALVRVDTIVLAQTIGAALSNAVDFAKTSVRLDVRRAEGNIVASIFDDGPGVDPVFAARVGEPFLVDWTRRSRASFRFGLSLAAAVLRAKALGGSLSLSPGPDGRGACCTITCDAGEGG